MSVDLTSQNRLAYPLLATRFFLPPLSVGCVPRPRLMERLNLGLHVPLTLISAPPGFGKSALIRQWIHHHTVDDQQTLTAGWLSLEPSDADFGLFFRYLVAAWQHIFPQVGETALAEWKENASIRKEILLDLLLNDILAGQENAGTGHALLVLDDYHRIESSEIHETVAYLVEHLPPGPADALTLLAGWLEQAKANGRGRNWLSICLITALAYDALGDRKKAFQLLRDGLVFALAEGHRLALVEEGEALRDLLEAFRVQFPQSPFAEYVTEILTLFPAPFPSKTGLSGKVDGLYETLSPREVEILRLVCQGLSNQEIARQLVLSVGTVKFHIHHIFGKLGVRDRPQAIAKAVQLRM